MITWLYNSEFHQFLCMTVTVNCSPRRFNHHSLDEINMYLFNTYPRINCTCYVKRAYHTIYRLTLGLFCVTMFLSMWISNTAATTMMLPIVETVLLELEAVSNWTSLNRYQIVISFNSFEFHLHFLWTFSKVWVICLIRKKTAAAKREQNRT